MVKRLDAIDGERFVVAQVEQCQVEVRQVQGRLLKHAALERHTHKAGESVQPRCDLLHHGERGSLAGDDDAGEAHVRGLFRPSRQRLQKRGPLRAEGAANVHDVNPRLALHRLQQRSVSRYVPECCPRARFLQRPHSSISHKLEIMTTT